MFGGQPHCMYQSTRLQHYILLTHSMCLDLLGRCNIIPAKMCLMGFMASTNNNTQTTNIHILKNCLLNFKLIKSMELPKHQLLQTLILEDSNANDHGILLLPVEFQCLHIKCMLHNHMHMPRQREQIKSLASSLMLILC